MFFLQKNRGDLQNEGTCLCNQEKLATSFLVTFVLVLFGDQRPGPDLVEFRPGWQLVSMVQASWVLGEVYLDLHIIQNRRSSSFERRLVLGGFSLQRLDILSKLVPTLQALDSTCKALHSFVSLCKSQLLLAIIRLPV